jgi:hypothetical protein
MAKLVDKDTAAAVRRELAASANGLITDQVQNVARAIEILLKAIER